MTSKAAGGLCPNSEQGYICWARVLQAQAVTDLYLHREVSPMTETCQDVTQEVVPSDHETSMPTRDCMMS